jgi:hypothetical protein
MQRQDEFLRDLLVTLKNPLPGIAIAQAIDAIEARLSVDHGVVTYHVEVQDREYPGRWHRQVTHHEVLEQAQDSASEIHRFWAKGRSVRLFKRTTRTQEELIHEYAA